MSKADELAKSIVHRYLTLMRYRHHVNRCASKHTKASGRQVAVLRYLDQHSPVTVGEISDYLYVRDATTSPLLERMEQEGYVTRRRSEKDNRKVLIEPTEEGRRLAKTVPLGPIGLMRADLPKLPTDELEMIDRAMARLSEIAQVDESLLE
jgi:DNA-binding MarR family transcriptional regulator